MDLNTTNRNTYIKHINPERAQLIDPTKKPSESTLRTTAVPMQSLTQTRSDYVFHKGFRPPKLADVDPYLSDLNRQIYPGNM